MNVVKGYTITMTNSGRCGVNAIALQFLMEPEHNHEENDRVQTVQRMPQFASSHSFHDVSMCIHTPVHLCTLSCFAEEPKSALACLLDMDTPSGTNRLLARTPSPSDSIRQLRGVSAAHLRVFFVSVC